MPLYPPIQAPRQELDENFPVGSLIFPKHARQEILHFYAFARHCDDIADDANLVSEEKESYLKRLQFLLKGELKETPPEWMAAYVSDVHASKTTAQYGVDLLRAFIQDAHKTRYETEEELLDYCRYSANPVGRVMLELCGEIKVDLVAADALCTVLQLINHLQDCKEDYLKLGRVYLPQVYFKRHGVTVEALSAAQTSIALRGVFQDYLVLCSRLLQRSIRLPETIRSWRLRLELALIFELACALVAKLSKEDPLQRHVNIAHWRWVFYLIKALKHLW